VDAKSAADARLKPPLDVNPLSTAYVAEPVAVITDELEYPEFTAKVDDATIAATPLEVYP
jgi:hypothetical protein